MNQNWFCPRNWKDYFEKGKPANVAISNKGADGIVVADVVAFVKDFEANPEPKQQ